MIYGEKFVAATREFSSIIDLFLFLFYLSFSRLLSFSSFLPSFFVSPLQTLTLSHYSKFSKVFPSSRVLFAFVCISTQRKADVNDASSANLFPINTVLTSGRLGFTVKENEKKARERGRGRREGGGEACGTIVHRAHSADL